ncbi:HlyD family efflux transporter periplasmic adaptor subunit [Cupriavidus oxalaticus]|uniref:Fusaric acid resistance efflux transporter,membrane fusion protein n=1 Tax=Cupriavidus oxalaticus TaxID=96344 RepID=A0A375FR44_9BURK|nr:HlyD family secretion protein [Cupriavidus oxalaticus]QRQ85449.1 HlyD family secretion protein [Cupriavidus oxalaticus]QRQ90463.1 HlyD family secretion protein [Cupriavidus oxalaticus]WQD84980.1 HlyD family secretion protein [Cupriavidus oxalaticus]SPC08322.1 Fusaric acid resistance efflux transporter,membrane fusion protein [Cupriavidus oxalaticus]SPC24252.1 Fusaric acid resistance efflux transporter,membrane fusion protein [Cupriavidus oxalaticus]
MNRKLSLLGPYAVTLAAVFAAALTAWHLWQYYTEAPWTRDGHVRADVIQVAPDVSGLVTAVMVGSNAWVQRGQLLFVVDEARFSLALRLAQAEAASARAALALARRNPAAADSAQARVAAADAAVEVASLNLARCRVTSPADGYVSDRLPRAGDFASRGRAALSVVASGTQYVEGYFEETKLPAIRVGSAAEVHIMGLPTPLRGRVQSIAPGIEDQDRNSGPNMLPSVNPTFNWVRLAQRIPVRIALDKVPPGVRLIAGQTATVRIRNAYE